MLVWFGGARIRTRFLLKGTTAVIVMNRDVASEFPASVPCLPMFPSISATLLVEIRLGYVLLAYSLWYFVIYFGNAL